SPFLAFKFSFCNSHPAMKVTSACALALLLVVGTARAQQIERANADDNITASAQISGWGGVYLVWDADNWCGVGKISPTPFGRFYTIVVEGGKRKQVEHRGVDFGLPHVARAALASDQVRFQYRSGDEWIDLR